MDKKERRLMLVMLFTAIAMLVAGTFFRGFLIYIWESTMQIYVVGHGIYLAATLLVYFGMVALFGAAIGLLVHAYAENMVNAWHKLIQWVWGTLSRFKRSSVKQKS